MPGKQSSQIKLEEDGMTIFGWQKDFVWERLPGEELKWRKTDVKVSSSVRWKQLMAGRKFDSLVYLKKDEIRYLAALRDHRRKVENV
tara:strand:+ start:470 stop:730 length:261 start_codon:yes stop_codon:yes gene_type:complete